MNALMKHHGGLYPNLDSLVNKENGDHYQCRQSSFGDIWFQRCYHFLF